MNSEEVIIPVPKKKSYRTPKYCEICDKTYKNYRNHWSLTHSPNATELREKSKKNNRENYYKNKEYYAERTKKWYASVKDTDEFKKYRCEKVKEYKEKHKDRISEYENIWVYCPECLKVIQRNSLTRHIKQQHPEINLVDTSFCGYCKKHIATYLYELHYSIVHSKTYVPAPAPTTTIKINKNIKQIVKKDKKEIKPKEELSELDKIRLQVQRARERKEKKDNLLIKNNVIVEF
jgi:hypothetical protein